MSNRAKIFAASAGISALVPTSVLAADGSGGFSLLGSFLQMVAALAIVIGLILLFHHLSTRWLKTTQGGFGAPRYIRVIETRYLAPKKSLLLIEVGGEYLLLASAGDQITFIKQIDMLEEIEVLDIPGESRPFSTAFRDKLHELLQKKIKRADHMTRDEARRAHL